MVATLSGRYRISDRAVLNAMSLVRRHAFIPGAIRATGKEVYGDHALAIGEGQTISQPFIVAWMTSALGVTPGDGEPEKVASEKRVLEIGTGSGYQAAVLAELGVRVFGVELVAGLADHARAALEREGYGSVAVKTGDGWDGWPEYAPYPAILVAAAADEVPPALVEQLAEGGRMVIPLGRTFQNLVVLTKTSGLLERSDGFSVRFVPLVSRK